MAGAYTTCGRLRLRLPVRRRDGTVGTATLEFWRTWGDRLTEADRPRCEGRLAASLLMHHTTLAGAAVVLGTVPALVAEVRRLRDAAGWRPIATAPRDRTPVLAWVPLAPGVGERVVATYLPSFSGWYAAGDDGDDDDGGYGTRRVQPTHWQALPPPPEDAPC